ncbi:ketopantoate reductase family protein [Loigolactobacillus zhaoyuanensis]|uniref:Ketopantoate reductase family protein n=1 Tax=Loigolactobacillus zhaoyuanensis TaxID=2486017 RepID=A0ABW8UDV6_9LACO
MSEKQPRVLIFGAGVIGSAYAIKFIEAGIDLTLLARGNRFESLQKHGLLYKDKKTVKALKVNVIDTLANDDIYDFIIVTVRYDKAESALLALKNNQSPNIVTMISNPIGFSKWQAIIGTKLIPAFPGVGGQMNQGVLNARYMPKVLAATTFGEVNGSATARIEKLANLFKTAKRPYTINRDMQAYLMTHSVSDIAMLGSLYSDNKTTDKNTAKKITTTLKVYLSALQKAGITVNPAALKIVTKTANWLLNFFFMRWLQTKMVKEMRLAEYATSANNEIKKLKGDLLQFLGQNNGTLKQKNIE